MTNPKEMNERWYQMEKYQRNYTQFLWLLRMRLNTQRKKECKPNMHRCTHTKSHYSILCVFCLWLVFTATRTTAITKKCIYWKIEETKKYSIWFICLHFLLNLFDVALICFCFLNRHSTLVFSLSLSLREDISVDVDSKIFFFHFSLYFCQFVYFYQVF